VKTTVQAQSQVRLVQSNLRRNFESNLTKKLSLCYCISWYFKLEENILNELKAVCRIRLPFLPKPDSTIFEIPDPDFQEKKEIWIRNFVNSQIWIRLKKTGSDTG